MDEAKQEIAFHEAGHAVMAKILGISIHHITIEPGSERPDVEGYVLAGKSCSLKDEVSLSIAGFISRALRRGGFQSGQDPKAACSRGCIGLLQSEFQDDFGILRELKQDFPSRELSEIPDFLEMAGFALQKLAANWRDVLKLVSELEKQPTLYREDLARILGPTVIVPRENSK